MTQDFRIMAELHAGAKLTDCFTLIRRLGEGATAWDVWLANDDEFENGIAAKAFFPLLSADRHAVAGLKHQRRKPRRLNHPATDRPR